MNLNLYFPFTKIIILLEVYLQMQLDRVDRKILNELYNDSRLSMRELAKRVNLSAPSTAERVRKLESEGVIQNIQSISTIKSRTSFRLYFRNHFKMVIQHVCNSLFSLIHLQVLLPSNRKLMLHCKISVPSLVELEEFINDVSSYATTVSHIVLSEVSLTPDIEHIFPED